MESHESLIQFFGWCTAINFVVLFVTTLFLVLMRNVITKLHARMFGIDEKDVSLLYFQYVAQYKIAVIVFSLVPYLALKLMN